MPRPATTQSNHEDLVTLRDLVDLEIRRLETMLTAAKELEVSRHEAIDAKLAASHNALQDRLHFLNELRNDVITKTEYSASHESLANEFHGAVKLFQAEISGLKEWKAEQGGKASQTAVVGAYIIATAGWLIGPLVAIAIERMIK